MSIFCPMPQSHSHLNLNQQRKDQWEGFPWHCDILTLEILSHRIKVGLFSYPFTHLLSLLNPAVHIILKILKSKWNSFPIKKTMMSLQPKFGSHAFPTTKINPPHYPHHPHHAPCFHRPLRNFSNHLIKERRGEALLRIGFCDEENACFTEQLLTCWETCSSCVIGCKESRLYKPTKPGSSFLTTLC